MTGWTQRAPRGGLWWTKRTWLRSPTLAEPTLLPQTFHTPPCNAIGCWRAKLLCTLVRVEFCTSATTGVWS